MEVTHGAVVAMNYTLKDDEGELIDKSEQPLVYLHGFGNIIPGLEKGLEGAEISENRSVVVEAAEAYGETDPAAIIKVPSDTVPEGVELEPGMVVLGDTPSGSVQLTVVEINDDHIVVDGNHPLAGQRLHFEVEIVGVRAASKEELAEGCPQRV
jgi:FKBP-type peptidyl-prolyl cis-trans isomerase SlyD